jgi:hypothetical protein
MSGLVVFMKKTILTFGSFCLAVFLFTMKSRSPAMALAVPEDTRRLTPSRRLKNNKAVLK